MKAKFTFILVAAIGLLATVSLAYAAGKGKGGGGGPGGGDSTPQGTIYYLGPTPGYSYGNVTFSMSPDGSNQAPVAGGGWMAAFGKPSWDLHNNHRWFLGYRIITGENYPDGEFRRELFAYRDDYNPDDPETLVQLTDDITLETLEPRWLPGDGTISIIGMRWDGSTVVEGGIYTVDLAFDVVGNIIGTVWTPTDPTFPMPLYQPTWNPYPVPDIIYYSWDPTGSTIAYSKASAYGIWMDDLSGPEVQIFFYIAGSPEWSPDGSQIVFSQSGSIYTMKANGKRVTRVVHDNSEWSFGHPHWSPDSQFLVFDGSSRLENKADVFRAKANGSAMVQLTNSQEPEKSYTLSNFAGWR